MNDGRPAAPGFRPDLEGLRGIAILLVLLCHVRLPGAEAGFVGVDVFFVLSGFLITGLLVTERERTGRLDLRAFYARRARRIIPAALLVLACTLLAAQLLLSPLDLPRVGDDVLAAGLSLANVHFALGATDYFAPIDASPVLHYWSLGVEEQFYLVWPVLLLAAARFGRPRAAMAVATVVVLVGSFLLAVDLTRNSAAWAYYSLPTRGWQLAAGGLLALAAPVLARVARLLGPALGVLGVVLLATALVAINATTEYPGVAALLPTLGASALIASGGGASRVSAVLAWRPLRGLGRISYSLYLWHWPILILGSVALGVGGIGDGDEGVAPDDLPIRIGLVLLAVAVSTVSWRFVEEPFRRPRARHIGPVRGFGLAGAAVLAVVITSATMGAAAARSVAQQDAAAGADLGPLAELPEDWPESPAVDEVDEVAGTAPPDNEPAEEPPPTIPPPPTDSPSPTATPRPQPSTNATQKPTPKPTTRPSSLVLTGPRTWGPVPSDLLPTLANARNDSDPLLRDGCALSLTGTRPPSCTYGDRGGKVTVALVGDSHAAHLFPALQRVAKQRGWRLVPLTKFSCVFVDMRIWSPRLKREYTECEEWRENVVSRLVELRPDLVVVVSNRWFPVVDKRDEDPKRQGAAMARLLDRVPGVKAIVVDTPRSAFDVPACLAEHRDAIEKCVTSRAASFGWRHRLRELEAGRLTGAKIVDLSRAICPTDPCPPVIGRTLVYRDNHHLTATFAASLAGVLNKALPAVAPKPQ